MTGLKPLADADSERECVSKQEDDMSTRIIGIDLAVTAAHQAVRLGCRRSRRRLVRDPRHDGLSRACLGER